MFEDPPPAPVAPPAAPHHTGISPGYYSILQESNVAASQRAKQIKLLEELESPEFNNGKSPNAVIGQVSKEGSPGPTGIDSADVPVFASVLRDVGDVEVLSLILHSPGGDGNVVEKIVNLCRAQCKHFRVIIPNKAKSAATMIALGADEIIMGNSSEIGPIDAQVPVITQGLLRYLSAQSFIDARDSLLAKHAEAVANKQDVAAILQMLASLDIPFIEECQRMMDFGREVVRKLLTDYMFAKASDRAKKVEHVVNSLSSVQTHKVHGRFIDGNTARSGLKLKVRLLAKNDPLWQKVTEYYTRADISMGANTFKIFETKHTRLTASAS